MWNTSVSDHCCHHCDGVVHKADSVIDTIHHEDKCQTIETSVCRILPGMLVLAKHFHLPISLLKGYNEATEETEFSYKNCCTDETGTIILLLKRVRNGIYIQNLVM